MSDTEIDCCCEERAKWYAKMPPASLPAWDKTFLAACQSSGSIIECRPDDGSSAAAWGRLLGVTLIGGALICVAWLFYLR